MHKILDSNQRLKMVNLRVLLNLIFAEILFYCSALVFMLPLTTSLLTCCLLAFSCQVLQRKTEEAFVATKRLRELLEFRKSSSGKATG